MILFHKKLNTVNSEERDESKVSRKSLQKQDEIAKKPKLQKKSNKQKLIKNVSRMKIIMD